MRHDIGNVDAWPGSLANFASKAVVMTDDYDNRDDLWKSYHACMAAVRERIAAGGPGWTPKAASDEKSHDQRA
jgi:hypothetical protein